MNRHARTLPAASGFRLFAAALGAICSLFMMDCPARAAAAKAPPVLIKPGDPLPANFNPVLPSRADRVDLAAGRGLEFLMDTQAPDGRLHDSTRQSSYETTTTSLGVMAFAASGHHPMDRTPEGLSLRRALDFVLRSDRQVDVGPFRGSFGATDRSMMYGHGITTTTLAQVLEMGLDPEKELFVRTRTGMALNLILNAQHTRKNHSCDIGGWRYTPDSVTSDVTVTAWQVLALLSARRAGFSVSNQTFESTAAFLRRCFAGGFFVYDHIELELPFVRQLQAQQQQTLAQQARAAGKPAPLPATPFGSTEATMIRQDGSVTRRDTATRNCPR